ncbi:MAG: universal stress protein [Geminicoccaceae bacterium]|jgi:nucleotide-binding universal stress UspA family protein|nr:universal stress protein [Geminicoccaceae bacterium]
MSYRTMLLQMFEDAALTRRLTTAVDLARQFQGHLTGLNVAPPPVMPFGYGEAAAYVGPEIFEAQRQANEAIARRLEAAFGKATSGQGIAADWRSLDGDYVTAFGKAAHTADLVITGQVPGDALDALAPQVTEFLVTEAGGPVLMLPASGSGGSIGQRIILGWNGSKEAKRAVLGSLPFLRGATQVWLVTVGDPEAVRLDAARTMLERHDIRVEPVVIQGSGQEAGAILLEQAQSRDADLVVMGAYGHSRLREFFLGGATRHVLQTSALPILFGG